MCGIILIQEIASLSSGVLRARGLSLFYEEIIMAKKSIKHIDSYLLFYEAEVWKSAKGQWDLV